jgi:replicative DNA helicase
MADTPDPVKAEIGRLSEGLDVAPPPPEPKPQRGRRKRDPMDDIAPTLSVVEAVSEWRSEERRGDKGAVSFGWPAWDDEMKRMIRPGEVIGLGARTGVGKTWIAQHMSEVNLAADDDHYVCFVTLEMPAYQMAGRLAAHALEMPPHRAAQIAAGDDWTPDVVTAAKPYLDRMRLYEKPARVEQLPLIAQRFTIDTGGRPPTIMVVDYMGLLAWGGRDQASTYERTSHNAKALKEVAKELRCVILSAVQINREGGGSGFKEPSMSDLRDSGALEEAADRIFLFWSVLPDSKDGWRQLGSEVHGRVAKNRHGGGVGAKVVLRYDDAMRLSDWTEHQYQVDVAGAVQLQTPQDIPF